MRILKVLGSMFVWSTSVLAWLVGGLAAALFVGFVWLTATESGTHWLMAQANQRVDGLQIEATRGTLWRGLTVEDLQYRQSDGLRLDARQINAQLDWRQFWHLNLQLGTLSAQDVQIHLPATPAQPKPEGTPLDLRHLPLQLPVGVDVTHLSLQRVVLILADGSAYRLDDLQAGFQASGQDLTLQLHRSAWVFPGSVLTTLRGELSVMTASPHRLKGRLQAAVDLSQGWLETSVALGGQLADVRADLTSDWTGFDFPDAQIRARTRITPERLVLERLGVDTLGGTVCAQGQIDYGAGLKVSLAGKAEALNPGAIAPRLSGHTSFDFRMQLTRPVGQAALMGQVDLSQVRGKLARVPIQALTARLKLAAGQMDVAVSGTQAAGGALTLDAQLGLTGDRTVTAKLTTTHLDVAPLLPHLPAGASARVSLQAGVQGRLGADSGKDVQLGVTLAPVRVTVTEPETAGAPAVHEILTGQLQGSVQDQTARISHSEWHWGNARLSMQGKLAWGQPDLPMALKAALSVPDLGRLPWRVFGLPSAMGTLQLDADLNGALFHPKGAVDVHARHLSMADWRLARLDAQGKIAPGGGAALTDAPVRLQVTAADLRRSSSDPAARTASQNSGKSSSVPSIHAWMRQFELTVDGRWTHQDIALRLDGPAGALALSAQGGMQGVSWQGMLRRLSLSAPAKKATVIDAPDRGTWHLQSPVRLDVSAQAQRLGNACLIQGDSRLCLAGTHQAKASSGSLTGNLALSLLTPWLPAGTHLPGRLTLDAHGEIAAGLPSGIVHVALPDNVLSMSDLADGKRFAYRQAHLDAKFAQGQVKLDYRAEIQRLLDLQGTGSLALAGVPNVNLATRISMKDLGALAFAVPQATRLAGSAEADITLTGPLAHPRPSGRFQVQNLAFILPDTGVGYDTGKIEGQIDSQGQLRFSGQIDGKPDGPAATAKPPSAEKSTTDGIAPRRLQVRGTGNLAQLPDWRIDVSVDGNAVPVLRIPSLTVDASPHLTIRADQRGAKIGGSVLLPLVTARIEKLPESAVRSTPDLVIVGAKAAPKTTGYPLQGDIALKLGDAVTLTGMGFSTGITGGLNLRLRPEKPLAAFGEIDLKNGVYKAYGQNLAIQSGQLIFVGPLTDPGLSVTASRTVDSNVVGLKIGGTLHDPKTTVFSQPSMPESDALSLLLTGRKLNSSSSTDASMLINAVTGLGIAQGDDIARDIGQKFGFDSVGLDTTGGLAGTRLTLGKRLGDNLLVRYAIGVTTGVGEVITEYKLNKLFSIEVTASPTATGGDLIYRIH